MSDWLLGLLIVLVGCVGVYVYYKIILQPQRSYPKAVG